MSCHRHPGAPARNGLCPACLFEVALASGSSAATPGHDAMSAAAAPLGGWRLTVTMPLGASASSTVWLARDERAGRLLRLKTWRTPAAEEFVRRIDALREALRAWGDHRIVPPAAAWTDDDGRAVVLSEFRQGVPLADGLATGTVDPARVRSLLDSVATMLEAAHARGLAHGSVGPGNVLVPATGVEPQVLDFGLAVARGPGADWIAADRAGLRDLERRVGL